MGSPAWLCHSVALQSLKLGSLTWYVPDCQVPCVLCACTKNIHAARFEKWHEDQVCKSFHGCVCCCYFHSCTSFIPFLHGLEQSLTPFVPIQIDAIALWPPELWTNLREMTGETAKYLSRGNCIKFCNECDLVQASAAS